MKVHLINNYKDKFKDYLQSADTIDNAFYFEIIENWQKNWNIEALDLLSTYDKSLKSVYSARLWGGSHNSAKTILLQLIETDKEFIRIAFKDLFSDHRDLGLRLDRFSYHCQQIFKILHSKNKKLTHHFHNDRGILCLYLALEYPEKYALWNYPAFSVMMNKIESNTIPTQSEVDRYYKSCNGICKLISKDEELLLALQKHIPKVDITKPNMMIMSLFMEFVATQND
ncbi:MAG: hypothetical protein V3V14_03585 [Saprospiraceae bacterium]